MLDVSLGEEAVWRANDEVEIMMNETSTHQIFQCLEIVLDHLRIQGDVGKKFSLFKNDRELLMLMKVA